MQAGEFRRCTHLDVLKGIRRNLLARFLRAFATDLAAQNISLPSPNLADTDFLLKAEAIFTKDLPDNRDKTGLIRSWPHDGTYEAFLESDLLLEVRAVLKK